VLATIINIEQNVVDPDEKLDMLINYGTKDVPVPTDENFTVEGLSLFTGGRGIYLSLDEVAPGSWIKVYLKLQNGIAISFCIQ